MKSRPVKSLSAREIERFRQRLLGMKRDILTIIAEIEDEALHNGRTKDLVAGTVDPGDAADKGTENYEREVALGLAESERKILMEIEHALQKIAEGMYGICEGTDKPITRKRLEALPYARYCAEYARQLEQRSPRPASISKRVIGERR